MSSLSHFFFGVFVPRSQAIKSDQKKEDGGGDSSKMLKNDDNKFVFRDMKRALDTMKSYEMLSPRFKKFSSFDEALEFSRDGGGGSISKMHESGDKKSSHDGDEQPRPFPAPTPQQLTELKKAIDSKNTTRSAELIRSNPRYLINCDGDAPTILQVGFRYNALHVAARSGDFDTAYLILDLLKSIDYIRRLFPDDPNVQTTEQRRRVLLDFYLNTPEKGYSETPLHFAAKKGHLRLVELFLSFRECDKYAKNKDGITARQLLIKCDKVNPEEKEAGLQLFVSKVGKAFLRCLR